MTIWCKNAHRLELQKFLNFCAAHLPVKRDIEMKFSYFLFWTCMSEIRNREFHVLLVLCQRLRRCISIEANISIPVYVDLIVSTEQLNYFKFETLISWYKHY